MCGERKYSLPLRQQLRRCCTLKEPAVAQLCSVNNIKSSDRYAQSRRQLMERREHAVDRSQQTIGECRSDIKVALDLEHFFEHSKKPSKE